MFLSIIIAAYHAQDYVGKCLDSILHADLKGAEILVVLSRTDDRTNAVCRGYEQKGLVTCVTQDKKGLSNARNCGMRMAGGEYLTFIDADDYVETKRFAACMRRLKKILRKRSYDVIVNDFWFAGQDGNLLFANKQIRQPGPKLLDDSCAEIVVRSRGTFWNVWRYIYRTDYLRACGRIFWEGRCCEDLDFSVRTFLETDRMAFLHMPYYCYCPIRPQSLMNSKDLKMLRDFWLAEKNLLSLCRQDGSPLADAVSEKLKELAVLNLPDILEVDRHDRKAAIQGYQRLFLQMEPPGKWWPRQILYAGRTDLIIPVGCLLYAMRYLRRKYRYHRIRGEHRC